jgi:hypothetical protein
VDTVTSALRQPVTAPTSEPSCIGLIDDIIKIPITRLIPEIFWRRDYGSSTGSQRPDSVFLLENVPILRGEEKAKVNPQAELKNKIKVWNFPGVPYFLAYHTTGSTLTFDVIYRDANSNICVDAVTPSFDLISIVERLEAIRCVFLIGSIVRSLVQMNRQRSSIPPFVVIPRANGKTIELLNTKIKKTWPLSSKKEFQVYSACSYFNTV